MNRFRGGWWGYILAVAATAMVLGLRGAYLNDLLEERFPLALFMIAVIAAAWSGGFKPGMFAVALSLIVGVYLYTDHDGLYISLLIDRLRIGVFLLVGTLISALCETVQMGQRRLGVRQKQLAEQEERFRMAVESADIGTWELDVPTGRRQWSQRARAMFGLTSDQDVSRLSFLDLIHPQDRDRTGSAIEAALDPAGSGRYDIDYRTVRTDGEIRWIVAKGQAFFDESGNDRRAIRFIGTVLDITDRKRMEESLREADRRKDEFLAILAHELRNPMVPLQRALQVWPSIENEPAELASMRPMLHRQVQQMMRLVDDLLDVARITQGKLELRSRTIELASVITSAVETLDPLIQQSRRRFTVTLPEHPVWIEGDSNRLTQVLCNIIHNAVKFTDDDGTIELSAVVQGDAALISICDDGIGIPPHMLTDIFAAFHQIAETPRGFDRGLGIGLNLAMQIVELHGGALEARSNGLGQGSEFIVTLPMVPSRGLRRAAGTALRTCQTPRRRVLIVDDVREAAETLAVILRARGQDVSVACDGHSAINAALADRPDVVFLDIGMPGMDGYEVARRLRVMPELDGVVLVALTGFGDQEAIRKAMEAGFHHHVVKTADIEQLEELFFSARR